jgi:hypothetical protein
MKRRANAESYKALHTQLLEDTAKLIGHPADALVTRFVALARLKMETIEVQLIAGNPHAATATEIDILRQQLEPFMPRPGLEIRVKFADPIDAAKPGAASVCGLERCRRCGWQPPNNDAVSICYRCSWTDGCDPEHTPRQLLAGLAEPAPAPETAPVGAGENVVPLKQSPQQSDEDRKADRMAELRTQARPTGGVAAPVQAPRINYNSDGGSCSDLMKRINSSYV